MYQRPFRFIPSYQIGFINIIIEHLVKTPKRKLLIKGTKKVSKQKTEPR